MKKRFLLFFTLILVTVFSYACTTQPEPVYVQGDEKDTLTAQAEPYVQDILTGIQNADFTTFKKDFDEGMLAAMTEKDFSTIIKAYGTQGAPQATELINIEDITDFYRLNYKVTYADMIVIIQVVLPKTEPRLVSGLWFK